MGVKSHYQSGHCSHVGSPRRESWVADEIKLYDIDKLYDVKFKKGKIFIIREEKKINRLSIEYFNIKQKENIKLLTTLLDHRDASMITLNSFLYIIGGHNLFKIIKKSQKSNLINDERREITSFNYKRGFKLTAVVNGKVYVFSVMNIFWTDGDIFAELTPYDVVKCYDPHTDIRTEVAPRIIKPYKYKIGIWIELYIYLVCLIKKKISAIVLKIWYNK